MLIIENTTIKLTRGDTAFLTIPLKKNLYDTYELAAEDILRFTVKKKATNTTPLNINTNVIPAAEMQTVSIAMVPSGKHLELEIDDNKFEIPYLKKTVIVPKQSFYEKNQVADDSDGAFGYSAASDLSSVKDGAHYTVKFNDKSFSAIAILTEEKTSFSFFYESDGEIHNSSVYFYNDDLNTMFCYPETVVDYYVGSAAFILEIIGEEVVPLDPKYIQLTSPNGTKYSLSVSNNGTLSAVPIA